VPPAARAAQTFRILCLITPTYLKVERKSVKIVWEQSVYGGTAPIVCVLCGQAARPIRTGTNQLLIGVIYDRHGTVGGEVCHNCIALGSEGIRSMLVNRIATMRTKLSELEAIAQGELQLPSIEQEFYIHRHTGA